MPMYGLGVLCDLGDRVHATGVVLDLSDGPDDTQSIGNAYQGNVLPEVLAVHRKNKTKLPIKRKVFEQKNDHKIFLSTNCELDRRVIKLARFPLRPSST